MGKKRYKDKERGRGESVKRDGGICYKGALRERRGERVDAPGLLVLYCLSVCFMTVSVS